MTEDRVDYKYIGRKPRRYQGKKRIILENDQPRRLYVTDIHEGVNVNRQPYIVIECSPNYELILKGIRAISFIEQIPDFQDLKKRQIEIIQKEHYSSKGRKYYTVQVSII